MDGRLRNMTALYLLRGDEVLLLYRQGSRVIRDSYTGTAGGHFEPDELNDARRCALRELTEETGLIEADLEDLALRYVGLRLKNGEVRQNYYFFARLKDPCRPVTSNEGRLTWVKLSEVDRYEMPATAQYMMAHYAKIGRYDDHIYALAAAADGAAFTALEEFGT